MNNNYITKYFYLLLSDHLIIFYVSYSFFIVYKWKFTLQRKNDWKTFYNIRTLSSLYKYNSEYFARFYWK